MSQPSPLFVCRLRLRDFRGYGPFDLEIPSAPCVVLLTGPNGLGKTTLFEAIEWGLTGTVRRLDTLTGGKTDPRDLARRDEGVDSFRVEISFRDSEGLETLVTRTQLVPPKGNPPEAIGTDVSMVAALLRSGEERWNVTGRNVADYLHLTHLHAQVAFLRLVTSSAKDRWVRVSPLAGADRFDRVRSNLTNTKAALTELRRRHEEGLAEAVARRERWQGLLRRVAELQESVAAIRDAVSPDQVVRELRELVKSLHLRTPGGDESAQSETGDALRAIQGARAAVEAHRTHLDGAIDRLSRLRTLPRRCMDLQAQHERARSQRATVEGEAAVQEERLASAASRAKAADQASQAAEERLQRAVKVRDTFVRAAQDREALGAAEHELSLAEEALKEAMSALSDAERAELESRQALARHDGVLKERNRVREEVDAVDRARAALEEKATLDQTLVAEEGRRSTLADALRTARAAEGRVRQELEASEAAVRNAESASEVRKAASARLQQAVAWIAEQLTDEDSSCPVCSSRFEAGRLRSMAHDALSRLDPHLAAAERMLEEAREQREVVQRRLRTAQQDSRRMQAELDAVEGNLKQLGARIESLSATPLFPALRAEEAAQQLEELRSAKIALAQQVDATLAHGEPIASIRKAVTDRAALAAERARFVETARALRSARYSKAATIRARMAQFATEHPALAAAGQLESAVDAAALEASMAADAAEVTRTERASADGSKEAAQNSVASVRERVKMLLQEEAEVDDTLGSVRKQWAAAGLPETISESLLDEKLEQAAISRQACLAALAGVERLATGLARWQDANDLHALEQEIQDEIGVTDRDGHARELADAEARTRRDCEAAERARQAADELGDRLQRVTAEFGDRAVKPFSRLFQRYLRALVHDERFHSIAVSYEAAARSAGLRFKVGLGGSDTEAEFILSEGQLGDVSLAAMLAASSTFPWSRWRALLLDDPTQYNDLIHATALFDVLRNLVLMEDYQVFVSAHDTGQAAFFRQKLVSLGIPGVECRYLGQGAAGIDVEIRAVGGQHGDAVTLH